MFREEREYRICQCMEVRKAEEGEESFAVEGYASTFDAYEMFEYEDVKYFERIEPTAFEECDMSDVIFCKDHTGTVFARTKNGTIELTVDEHGLKCRMDLSKTESARMMFEEIKAEMYTQMSIAFSVREDSYDKDTHTRTIQKIKKLYDVSAVSFPANPGTDISVSTRSRFDGFIEQEKAERLAKEKRLKLEKQKYFYERSKGSWN